jgi:hypothetical protein
LQSAPEAKYVGQEQVKLSTLDSIFDSLRVEGQNICLKIDTQGFDERVLKGAEKLLSRASILIVETSFEPLYKGQPLFDQIYDLLRQRGFVYMGTDHIIRNPNDGSILHCDSVFCKADL